MKKPAIQNQRNKDIIYFLLNGNTIKAAGKKYGVSGQRITQIVNKMCWEMNRKNRIFRNPLRVFNLTDLRKYEFYVVPVIMNF